MRIAVIGAGGVGGAFGAALAKAGADVTFVAVDQALLQLAPNDSWDVLTAMMGDRPLSVVTATAQTQVVGKRHYGRKAVEAAPSEFFYRDETFAGSIPFRRR